MELRQRCRRPTHGEIIKGNVTLGSLRGRQDYLIAEALLSPYGEDWNKDFDKLSASPGGQQSTPCWQWFSPASVS